MSFGVPAAREPYASDMAADRRPMFTGVSRHAVFVRAAIETLGPWPCTVVVIGETGAGKDMVARLLHAASGRRGKFVPVAGGEISPSLLHSTLFGHERGSFSGAVDRQLGLVELAAGGTLFLNELGDVTKKAQGALLRILEGRGFRRLGGVNDLVPDVRVVVGTQRELKDLVATGKLREEVAFRLGYEAIHLLPLRERREDLDSITEQVLARCARELA